MTWWANVRTKALEVRPDRSVGVLAIASMILSYGLIVLGSTVRVTNSGMGCPSWPLCYGHYGPVDQYNALLEQSHRYLVSVVTIAVFATALAAYRSHTRRIALVPAATGAGLILVQAGLGAVTVFANNAPWTVAVHLVVGFIFFGATTVTAVVALRAGHGQWSVGSVGRWGWVALVTTLLLVVAGTIVVGTGAGDDCPSWPLCTHSAPGGMIAWQLVHRTVAGIAGISLIGFVASKWRATAGWHRWRIGAAALVGLLVAAGGIGAGTALSRATAGWQDFHLAMAAALWGVLVTLVAMLATNGSAQQARQA
jgi:heme A synthase